MISNVGANGVSQNSSDSEVKKLRELRAKGQYAVPRGMTLTKLAKKFNMSVEDFKKMTGLKSSQLAAGQIIKGIPTDTIKAGKGLTSLAKEHGMSLKEFCELNGITKEYQPQKGEAFYVFNKNTGKSKPKPASLNSAERANKAESKASKPQSAPEEEKVEKTENELLAESLKTPDDIAQALKKSAKMTAAVGKDKFNIPFDKIDKNNVIDVIKKYDEISPRESLIDMISSEWGSSKDSRKASITKLYDTLAEKVGSRIATPEKREAFMKELDEQYDSWGMVSTKKMDKMINELIDPESAQSASGSAYKPKYDKDGIEIAKAGERSVATMGAKPPIPKDKNGNIRAEVIKFVPSNTSGPLAGKTITVNAGHGWAKNGRFKPGTQAKDSNNKTIPEWYKNRNFADKLIKKLTDQGATVIYTAGDASPVCDAKREFDSDLLISLHCNATPRKSKRGLEIYYPEGSAEAKKLADLTDNHLDKLVSFGRKNGENDHCIVKSDKETQHKSIGLLQVRKDEIPSILVEMGYQSNETDLKNIDSRTFQNDSMDRVTDAIIEYLEGKE